MANKPISPASPPSASRAAWWNVDEKRADHLLWWHAIDEKRFDDVVSLLSLGFPVDARNMYGETGLQLVLQSASDLHIVKVLVAAGAKLNFPHPKTKRPQPLFMAVENALPVEVVEGLLDLGARLPLAERQHDLLRRAVLRTSEEVVRLLLDRGANPNPESVGDIRSPLHLALEKGYTGIASALMDAGAEVHRVEMGRSKLMMAAARLDGSAMERLLDRGVDPTWKNTQGMSALDYAHPDHKPLVARAMEVWELQHATPASSIGRKSARL